MGNLKKIFENSFYQLLFVYAILVLLISLSFLYKFTFHFEIFAFILAILGISIISRETNEFKIKKIYFYMLFAFAIFLIILFRYIPYFNNDIPLGYDAGIYKYGIEFGLKNLDNWILSSGFEPGFLYLIEILKIFFPTQFILTYFLIFFCVLLGLSIYFLAKEFFNKKTALIALLIYSVSIIQFLTFWFMYYKNIIALSLLLFSILFLVKSKKNRNFIWLFVLFGGLVGSIHRPTFYIFGLGYFLFSIFSPYKNKSYDFKQLGKNILYGILIILIAGLFYIGNFKYQILNMIEPVVTGFVEPGEASGTFISFLQYQFSTLAYLPFAILGFFILIKKRDFNILFYLTLITAIIVYFQFFFFNRFIIILDIFLIILASIGFANLIENKKTFGTIVLILMLFSAGFVTLKESLDSKPLITNQELEVINYLNNTEPDAFVMAISSKYAPFVLGYSNRKTIAPGLFGYDKHTEKDWANFWKASNLTYIKDFMNAYKKPLYIFIGQKDQDLLQNYPDCFGINKEKGGNKIYKFIC